MEKPWLQHYPKEIPHTVDYRLQPLHAYLQETALAYPNKKAIHFLGKDVTFAEVYEKARRFASFLLENGLRKGDRVAIMLPNCPQAVIGYYGVLLAGGVVVQTNPLYTERELEYQLRDCGATIILCINLVYPKVSKMLHTTYLQQVIVTGIEDYLPFPKNMLYPFVQRRQTKTIIKIKETAAVRFWKTVMRSSPVYEEVSCEPDKDLALLQYTGGTTGFPKGVMLTHENLVANTVMGIHWLYNCKKGEEVVLGSLPFFHVYGMTAVMNISIMQAYKMVLIPKFDVEMILEAIKSQRVTLFPGAPTMYIALLNYPRLAEFDVSSVRACISGSAALPVEVQEQFERLTGGKLVEGYGLTESSPITHSNFLWGKRMKGSIGVPWPNTDARIVSIETGEKLPPREVGELIVKGPQIMRGYWRNESETEAVLKEGWLYTGDLGYMDEEGFFYIVDRKKDMIITSGFNVYPREVEEVLYEHEKVREAVVLGVPDAYRGESVKAFVVLKDGVTCTEEELDQFVRGLLTAYKVPREYEFRTELPKSMVGKILRRVLIEEMKK